MSWKTRRRLSNESAYWKPGRLAETDSCFRGVSSPQRKWGSAHSLARASSSCGFLLRGLAVELLPVKRALRQVDRRGDGGVLCPPPADRGQCAPGIASLHRFPLFHLPSPPSPRPLPYSPSILLRCCIAKLSPPRGPASETHAPPCPCYKKVGSIKGGGVD